MRTRNRVVTVIAALTAAVLLLTPWQKVRADAAPPPNAAASDIAPGKGTQVQMMGETVVLEVSTGSVTADFLMRNQGNAIETLDVRFPMALRTREGQPGDWGGVIIQKIRTWVDGTEYPNKQTNYDEQPWAVWPVRFAPGEDVHLRVQYVTKPVNWGVFGDYYYILETGAGWRGPIVQGDIVFRFPYPATTEMLASDEANAGDYYVSTMPQFIVEGNDLRWHFENLEPTSKNNVRLSMLYPSVWQAIWDARHQVHANPNDANAQMRLGQAYYAAIPIKHGWEGGTLAEHFGPLAEAALKRAVQLAPSSVKAHLAYCDFLTARAWSDQFAIYYPLARQEVARIYDLDAGNPDVRRLSEELDWLEQIYSTPTATLPASPKPAAAQPSSPTPTPMAGSPVTGSIVLQGGASAAGGTAGSTISITADFNASSPTGTVTQMRVASRYGGGCLRDSEMAPLKWEPFAARKTFTATLAINWIGFYVSAQFRDAQGNTSPVICRDISIEGNPAPPTTVAASLPTSTVTPTPPPTSTPTAVVRGSTPAPTPGRGPGPCAAVAPMILLAGLTAWQVKRKT